MTVNIDPGSFRDPSGFVFQKDAIYYRQVNKSYKQDYDLLLTSGLYAALVQDGLLISHEEVDIEPYFPENAYKVLEPQQVPFVSYPYEWCFSQLKDAALVTLAIQKQAMEHGMSLKDASAFNIQFIDNKPVLIDTLSFEKLQVGKPWVAYKQFCQHFLAPLALMSLRDVRCLGLFRSNLDGIPLELASKLLTFRTYLHSSLLLHIHLHARFKGHDRDMGRYAKTTRKVNLYALFGLIDSLEKSINKMEWDPDRTMWSAYYKETEHVRQTLKHKADAVKELLGIAKPDSVWDLGANTGYFSRLAAELGIPVVSFDMDPGCVELNYLRCKEGDPLVLPLVLDLLNPSPALGWDLDERSSILERGPVDLVLALALLHHLAIANNVPLGRIASFFHKLAHQVIIEFVPKTDPMVQEMLAIRDDIFSDYSEQGFVESFAPYFDVKKVVKLDNSSRVLYLMESKEKVK